MPTQTNPFTPAFGTTPYVLAGRDVILDDMRLAFSTGVGDPNLSTLIVGARGTGKTALMSRIRSIAVEEGWLAVGTTALPGMLDDLYEQAAQASRHLIAPEAQHRLSSISVGPVSAGWERERSPRGNWRTCMGHLLDQLSESRTGLLMTVDEVQEGLEELVQLAAVYQHFVTEGRNVALVMAGLPFHVDRLVSNKSVSFLRRSAQRRIGHIGSSDVEEALRLTVTDAGKDLTQEAADACVRAIDGFAYMLQLVGYRTWNAGANDEVLDIDSATRGIIAARRDMEEHVLSATYRELSGKDVAFLEAMLPDRHESRMSTIASRMGVSTGYAAKYKSRLLALGVIREQGRGLVTFDIPGLRSYVAARADEN